MGRTFQTLALVKDYVDRFDQGGEPALVLYV